MSEIIRLVVCQIECHPAFYRDRLAFMEEPFMPNSRKSSLSYLGSLGIPTTDLQELFKKEYLEWQKKRLDGLLAHPLLNEAIPCIIVFPEGSIPVDCLLMLSDFAKSRNATIVAGSHTILDTVEAKQVYSALGKEEDLHRRHKHYHDVTFTFVQNQIHEQKKQGVSPFDKVDTTTLHTHRITLHPIPITIENAKIQMATMVCADALQLPNIKGDYDIVSIVSYDGEPSHFDSYIDTQVGNNKVVIYCNDGRFGSSSINFPLDKRPVSFLFEAPLNGKVPKGDALLVIDVPTGRLATEVGVFNPIAQHEVKLLASITYKESAKEDQDVSKEVIEIEALANNQVRNARIASLIQKGKHNPNQKPRLDYLLELARKGIDSEKIWAAYAHDLVLELKGLADLEARFAQICSDKLVYQFVDGDLEPQTAASLQGFLRDCKHRIPTPEKASSITISKSSITKDAYINREDEVTRMLNCLDSGVDNLLEVSGLPQIGKSAVIDLALSRTALQRIRRVPLLNTSSPQYIIAELSGMKKIAVGFATDDSKSDFQLGDILREWDVLWLENCHNLLESEKWKSTEIEMFINDIVSIVQEGKAKTKLIFETTRSLPFELRDPSAISKIRISGFEREWVKHGVAIFDRQLRRLNFKPNDISMAIKEQFVRDLGGHPMAIIFCADASCEEGVGAVKEAIRRGTGFYKEVTDRVLKMVTLSSEDQSLLRILSGCRIEAPRDAISATCNFSATGRISNLSRLCLVDIVSPSTIRLPGVLRNRFRFSDLDLETRDMLHKNAVTMYTQMAKEFPDRVEFAVEAEYHAAAIDQVAKVATGLIDGRLSAARKFYEEHNFAKAGKALNALMIGSPSHEVIRLSALVDAQLGDLAPALAKAEKVLARNPSDIHFFSVLGKAVLTQSRPELGDTLVAISRKSSVAETRVSILEGRLALRRRDFQRAEICFRHALRSPGTDPWAYYYLGTTYLRIGELTEAINILYEGDEYLAHNPRLRGSVRNAIRAKLGVAYVLNGDLPAASTILENLKGEEPDNPETLYAYWLLTVKKEGVEKAEEAFEVFRNAKPKRWERGLYHLYYGLFLKALDKLDEANEHFDLAYKNERNNVYIMIQYAENLYSLALRARKDLDIELAKDRGLKCVRIVRRILEFDPDNAAGESLQIDLYNEFDIEISGPEGEK